MSRNFTGITNSLSTNDFWLDARPEHQAIFLAILMHCAFVETIHDIHGNKHTVLAGQLCASIRKIAEWTSKYTNKNEVVAALKYFSECGFLRHEIRHGKTLITVTESEVYSCAFLLGQTQTQTRSRQDPDTKIHDHTENIDLDLIDYANSSDWLYFEHRKLGHIKILVSEATEKLLKDGWTLIDINSKILQMRNYNPCMNGEIVNYLKKCLTNDKKIGKKCKSKTEKSKPVQKSSKSMLNNDNAYPWEKDSSEPPLARFMRTDGYKKN